jgi:gamma-glutamyl-gamma-aminobutyrate hydrolase PuuD
VMGVQWHPERMYDADALAQSLFRDLVAAARETQDSAPVSAVERSISR